MWPRMVMVRMEDTNPQPFNLSLVNNLYGPTKKLGRRKWERRGRGGGNVCGWGGGILNCRGEGVRGFWNRTTAGQRF